MNLPKIKVTRHGRTAEVEIDGQPFLWPIARDGIRATVDVEDAPTVTLTLVAESVEIVNDIE